MPERRSRVVRCDRPLSLGRLDRDGALVRRGSFELRAVGGSAGRRERVPERRGALGDPPSGTPREAQRVPLPPPFSAADAARRAAARRARQGARGDRDAPGGEDHVPAPAPGRAAGRALPSGRSTSASTTTGSPDIELEQLSASCSRSTTGATRAPRARDGASGSSTRSSSFPGGSASCAACWTPRRPRSRSPGSSARMLSREVHTSLRGRGMATVIRPFGFREFLRHRGEEPTNEPARWTRPSASLVEKRFREYLVEGGFPEAQGLPAATADRAPAGLRRHGALPRRGRAPRGVAGGRAPVAGAAVPAQPGRELQRPPAAPGPEGPGASAWGRTPSTRCSAICGRLPLERRAAGHRLGAASATRTRASSTRPTRGSSRPSTPAVARTSATRSRPPC